MKDFRSLLVWEKAHTLVLKIYKITESFPKHEVYGITSQVRRAAVSVPTNIAEGCGKDTDAELKRYCLMAMGSSSELEYLLLLSQNIGYLSEENYHSLQVELIEIRKMLNAFIQKLKGSNN